MSDLIPCRFCRFAPHAWLDDYINGRAVTDPEYIIECENGNCSVMPEVRGTYPYMDEVRAMWNAANALPAVQPAHVNETPKSEHEARDVLTVATNDDWQPIGTAPKRRVIDLWSVEGGRYPDAVWGVCGDTEGWTDANDHGNLEGGVFTHWRDRPAPPATKGGDA